MAGDVIPDRLNLSFFVLPEATAAKTVFCISQYFFPLSMSVTSSDRDRLQSSLAVSYTYLRDVRLRIENLTRNSSTSTAVGDH